MAKKAQSTYQMADKQFRAAFERQKVMLDMIDTDVATKTGINGRTLTERKAEPGKLRLSEFRRLALNLSLTGRDVCAVVGVRYEDPAT